MTQQVTHEPNSAIDQIRQTRIQKLADLADKGVNPYPYVFDKNADAADLGLPALSEELRGESFLSNQPH